MTDPVLLATRLSGAVWGHLVGDAVGVPYEFRSAQEITSVEFGASGTHGQPPGTWSDDGGGYYLLPTPSEEQQILATWAALVPTPVFDYAYSWGTQNSDQALESSTDLQAVFAAHNQ